MKLKFALFIALIYSVLLTSCCDKKEDPTPPVNRTVLVYMVAYNTLGQSSYDYRDLQEMYQAATNDGFNGGRLIVYHAPASGAPMLKEVTPNGIIELKQYDNNTYSIDSVRMKQVIADTKTIAPALDYGLILWSHANAWLENSSSEDEHKYLSIDGEQLLNPNAFGDDRGHYMKIPTLAKTLGHNQFSFIYFDCCLMASVEVCYELRHAAPYIIASGTEIPANGMPYHINTPLFFANPPMLKEAAQSTFNHYNSYSGSSRTCTMSLIATQGLDSLASITRQIFASTDTLITKKDIQTYDFNLQSLYDMKQYIHTLKPDSTLLTEWDEVLGQIVEYSAHTPSIFNRLDMVNYCGLGCYITNYPTDANYRGYRNQAWWNDVVKYKYQK